MSRLPRKKMIAALLSLKAKGKLYGWLTQKRRYGGALGLHTLQTSPAVSSLQRSILRDAPVLQVKFNPKAGATSSYILNLKGGQKAVFKPLALSGARREVGVYLISRMMGMDFVPTTVMREVKINGKVIKGSTQQWIKGGIAGDDLESFWSGLNQPLMKQYAKLNLFDFTVGNLDRHFGNMLWDPKRQKLIAIDHGVSLEPARGLTPRTLEEGYFPELQTSLDTLSAEDKSQFTTTVKKLLRYKETILRKKGSEPDYGILLPPEAYDAIVKYPSGRRRRIPVAREAEQRESIDIDMVFARADYLLDRLAGRGRIVD